MPKGEIDGGEEGKRSQEASDFELKERTLPFCARIRQFRLEYPEATLSGPLCRIDPDPEG